MKKSLLLVMAMIAVFAVAAVYNSGVMPKMQKAKMTQSANLKQAQEAGYIDMADLKSGKKQAVKVRKNVTGDAYEVTDTFYMRPAGAFYWGTDADDSGYPGMQFPAYADVTFVPNCAGAEEGVTTYQWYETAYDEESEDLYYALAGEDETYVKHTSHSPYKMWWIQDGHLYYNPSAESVPLVAVDNNEDFGYSYDNEGLYTFGGHPYMISDLATGELREFNICPYKWTYGLGDDTKQDKFNIGYLYLSTAESGQGDWTPDANWLKNMQKAYGTGVTKAKLTGICQMIDKPAAPYVLNGVTIRIGWYSSKLFAAKLELYRIGENGVEDAPFASSTSLLKTHPVSGDAFSEKVSFRFKDKSSGLEENGVVVDDAILMVLSGFREAYDNGNVQLFTTPIVAFDEEEADREKDFNAFARIEHDYNGTDGHTTYRSAAFGYYTDDTQTALQYVVSLLAEYDIEMPFVNIPDLEKDEIEIPAEGGSVDLPINASEALASFGFETEEGDLLPDWLGVETEDELDEESGTRYTRNSTLTLSADALPSGITGRQVEMYIRLRQGVEKKYLVFQGEKSGVNDVHVDKNVKSVKYYNLLGVESAEPFQGVNVVVTTYDDGSKAASKVVK